MNIVHSIITLSSFFLQFSTLKGLVLQKPEPVRLGYQVSSHMKKIPPKQFDQQGMGTTAKKVLAETMASPPIYHENENDTVTEVITIDGHHDGTAPGDGTTTCLLPDHVIDELECLLVEREKAASDCEEQEIEEVDCEEGKKYIDSIINATYCWHCDQFENATDDKYCLAVDELAKENAASYAFKRVNDHFQQFIVQKAHLSGLSADDKKLIVADLRLLEAECNKSTDLSEAVLQALTEGDMNGSLSIPASAQVDTLEELDEQGCFDRANNLTAFLESLRGTMEDFNGTLHCHPVLDEAFKAHVHEAFNQHLKTFRHMVGVTLLLHNSSNQLAHNLYEYILSPLPYEEDVDKPLIAYDVTKHVMTKNHHAWHEGISQVLGKSLSPQHHVRLRMKENRDFHHLYGMTKAEMCSGIMEMRTSTFWFAKHKTLKLFHDCVCNQGQTVVVCTAKYDKEITKFQTKTLQKVGNAVEQIKMEQMRGALNRTDLDVTTGTDLDVTTGKAAVGPCWPISCAMCVGNTCIDTAGNPSFNIFGAVQSRISDTANCMSGSCSMGIGTPPGWNTCQFMLSITMGMQVTANHGSCFTNALHTLMRSSVYISQALCLTGIFGTLASAVGFTSCKTIASTYYYYHVGKISFSMGLPIFSFIPFMGHRFHLTFHWQLHQPSPAPRKVCSWRHGWAVEYYLCGWRHYFLKQESGKKGSIRQLLQSKETVEEEAEDSAISTWGRRRRRRATPIFCGRWVTRHSQCIKEMNNFRVNTHGQISYQLLMGIKIPFVGTIGKWKTLFSFRVPAGS